MVIKHTLVHIKKILCNKQDYVSGVAGSVSTILHDAIMNPAEGKLVNTTLY